MQLDWGSLIAILGATAGAVAYVHVYIENIKERICLEIDKKINNVTNENRELRADYARLLNRYNARGVRVKDAFGKVKESHIKLKSDKENLWKTVYDLRWDTDELYKNLKLTKRERRMADYSQFREQSTKPDFDTLSDIENIDPSD